MLEIYNETLRDLLAGFAAATATAAGTAARSSRSSSGGGGGSCGGGHSGQRLEILSTVASGCNVPGAVQVGLREDACCFAA